MQVRRSHLAGVGLLLWIACTSSPQPASGSAAADAEAAERWHDLMETVIGPGYDDVLAVEAEKSAAEMDFARVRATAREMAEQIALGYGPLELRDIPDFATHARRTEAWLLDVAEAAQAQRGEEMRTLVLDGQLRHCEACHDAADRSLARQRRT
jgi:hypothetical protein